MFPKHTTTFQRYAKTHPSLMTTLLCKEQMTHTTLGLTFVNFWKRPFGKILIAPFFPSRHSTTRLFVQHPARHRKRRRRHTRPAAAPLPAKGDVRTRAGRRADLGGVFLPHFSDEEHYTHQRTSAAQEQDDSEPPRQSPRVRFGRRFRNRRRCWWRLGDHLNISHLHDRHGHAVDRVGRIP